MQSRTKPKLSQMMGLERQSSRLDRQEHKPDRKLDLPERCSDVCLQSVGALELMESESRRERSSTLMLEGLI